ncbi:MAG: universal stress protein [Acidimicrobiales bacterium]|jgi:nucleotide-binding universal stress UspA family protein
MKHGKGWRIVVGVDGSASSKEALKWAARQAELTGAWLVVVTTWRYHTSLGWVAPYPADFDPEADARHALDANIEEVLGPSPSVEVRTEVVEGHPALVLVETSKGADLLVVGSRGYGGFTGMLLGSVSEHCVTHAHCPVLVMRSRPDT